MIGGMPGAPSQPGEATDHPTLEDKVINDSKAYMRALAEMRGRPSKAAEEFVSQAANLTATEAQERGLIDMQATSLRDVLLKIHNREAKLGDDVIVLQTQILDIVAFEQTWRDELLAFITNPNIAYLLLMAGIYGLVIEGSNPGLIIPGVAGAISLILGLYALQLLPVNYAGLGLMALGVLLMITEAFVPSFGALGLGGIISFLVGSVMLIDSDVPDLRISPVLIGTASLTTAAVFFFILTYAVKAWRRPAASGNDTMIGDPAQVLKWRKTRGEVFAHGEVWRATGNFNARPGDTVKIREIDGLTLVVGIEDKPDNKEN